MWPYSCAALACEGSVPSALGNMDHKPAGSQGLSSPNHPEPCSVLMLRAGWVFPPQMCCSSSVPRSSNHPKSAGAACMCLLARVCVSVALCWQGGISCLS